MKAIVTALLLLAIPVFCQSQTARNFRVSTFAALGSPTEGNVRWCSDCNATAPATGGGTGAFCYADGSAYNCSLHTGGGGGGGSVSSVGLSLPNIFTVSGSPVTSSGTLTGTLATQSANRIFAGPTTGSANTPAFRALVAADLGSGTADSTKFLRGDLTWQTALGSVTSVALAAPAEFTVSGSPITGAGTLTLTKAEQSPNLIYAGPSSGVAAQPGFRSLVAADLPSIAEAKFLFSDITTANATTVMHGLLPKLSGSGSECLRGDGSWLACGSGGGGGGGDFSTNTTTSVANQLVVASGTGGKTGTFFTGTGIASLTSGVVSGITTSAGIAGQISDETGGGGVLVFSSSPTLTTPVIASFTNATHNHTGTSAGGQLALNAFSSSTGSGAIVGQTSPVLVTPNIGVATATSVNKVAITAPATGSTLTIDNGKTFRATNSITIAGTDGTTLTGPSGSGTILTADSTATLTNKTHTLPILGGNSGLPGTCTVGQRVRDTSVTPNAYYNCISTNVWGQELISGTVGAVSAASGGTGLVSGDAAGTVSISGATSGTKTFSTTLSAVPKCIVVPTSDLGGTRFWITKSTTTLTVNTSSSVTASFDYHCILIP